MVYIEDIITAMSKSEYIWNDTDAGGGILRISKHYFQFFVDMEKKVSRGKSLSTNQCKLAIRRIQQNLEFAKAACSIDRSDLKNLLKNPVYRIPPVESVEWAKEVRWVGFNKIALKYKFNKELNESIYKLADQTVENTHMSDKHFLTIIPIVPGSIKYIYQFCMDNKFKMDKITEDFFKKGIYNLGKSDKISVENDIICITVNSSNELSDFVNHMYELENV